MFFPISTDAPVYYWPFATVGLIAVNILVFLITGPYEPALDSGWVLVHGDGLHPLQWVSSVFAHQGFGHLFGNMVFLWVFGLVVEGKLGWQRFLACYLAIGVGESAIEQVLMLGYSGDYPSASLGASTAIYGIMAMAAVWAPKNEITFVYWFGLLAGTFDVAIGWLAGFYVGMDILGVLLSGAQMGTSWLHVAGALVGFPLGIVLYKRGIVDCEGWDMFHVWAGDYGATAEREKDTAEFSKKLDKRRKQQANQQADAARQQVQTYLAGGNANAAKKLIDKLGESEVDVHLDAEDLSRLIQGLHQAKRWKESAPLMAKLIQVAPKRADPVRLKLAQICVVELDRPARALELVAEVELSALPEPQQQLAAKIARKAQQMQAVGTVELDDGAV